MKKLQLFISLILLLAYSNLFSQVGKITHPPEANADLAAMYLPNQSNFDSFAIIYSGFARYFITANFGYELQKYENGQWIVVKFHKVV